MSLVTNNIIAPNIVSLDSNLKNQSSQIQKLNLYSYQNERSFDQVTKQNVNISYNEITKRYRFEIQKPENDIHIYQIWKKNNQLNNDRKYYYEKLRDWINKFKISLIKDNFTPTTLIEINEEKDHNYPTILVDAGIESRNGLDYCVLYFENKTIRSLQGIVLDEIPKSGTFNNVRFDIDASQYDFNHKGSIPSKFYGKYGANGFIKFDINSETIKVYSTNPTVWINYIDFSDGQYVDFLYISTTELNGNIANVETRLNYIISDYDLKVFTADLNWAFGDEVYSHI